MITFSLTSSIDAPIAVVFDVLTDFEGMPRFMSQIRETVMPPRSKLRPGMRFQQRRNFLGYEFTSRYRVVEVGRPGRLAVETKAKGVRASLSWQLADNGPRTEVETFVALNPQSAAARAVLLLGFGVKRNLERRAQLELDELKAECERRVAALRPARAAASPDRFERRVGT
jgi:Predicted integral membrane protein